MCFKHHSTFTCRTLEILLQDFLTSALIDGAFSASSSDHFRGKSHTQPIRSIDRWASVLVLMLWMKEKVSYFWREPNSNFFVCRPAACSSFKQISRRIKGSKYCVEHCFVLIMTDFGSLNPELSSKVKIILLTPFANLACLS